MQDSVFAWIALVACIVLLLPLGAMQVTNDVTWSVTDFVLVGLLLFGAGSAFVLMARKVPHKHWLLVGVGVVAAFVCVWAELAVGILTNLGR